MEIDRYLLVRAVAVYLTVIATAAVWIWRRPSPRAMAGAVLAFAWNAPVILALHVAATTFGWWRFEASGGVLLGMPVDLYFAWAWLWGVVPAIAFPSAPLVVVVGIALGVDLVLMPAAAPVLHLGSSWLIGEALGLAIGLVPGQLLARWTSAGVRLPQRAVLQVLAFSGLVVFVLPAVAIDGSGGAWVTPLSRPAWQLSLIVQLLAIPGLLGLTAVQEFVERGGGTPVPFDPPRRLVASGVYAYIGNPMQTSAVVLLAMLGVVMGNAWIAATGVVAHIYSAGLAGWDEDVDLRQRFGDSWVAYRRAVRRCVPRLRPWYPPEHPPAQLFVAESCEMCSEVGRWFAARDARGLAIVPAEQHPSRLRRIRYEPADGSRYAEGVEAVARALEHVHLGWALVSFLARLPIVRPVVQLLADASGAQPRGIAAPAPDRCASPKA
jgi:protein-S-isoprenylcysteine O-methyltransferase Ste14